MDYYPEEYLNRLAHGGERALVSYTSSGRCPRGSSRNMGKTRRRAWQVALDGGEVRALWHPDLPLLHRACSVLVALPLRLPRRLLPGSARAPGAFCTSTEKGQAI